MKKVAPASLVALEEALTVLYWYRRDLRRFVTSAIDDPRILSRLNWEDHKRNTVTLLVELLAGGGTEYQTMLLTLMNEVARFDDFSHLDRLDDGRSKAERARAAVAALARLLPPEQNSEQTPPRPTERREQHLDRLRSDFLSIVGPSEPGRRGALLERILRESFTLFDLHPKTPFRVAAEQVEGGFSLDNADHLLVATWQEEAIGVACLDAFLAKVAREPKNTHGLFLSVNGFLPAAVTAHSRGRPPVVLMDGADFMAVLEVRVRLDELLLRKRKYANQTGNVYLPISEVMKAESVEGA